MKDEHLSRWLHAESDAAALDLIGAVLQDTPQLILQLYLLAHALPTLSTSIREYSTKFGALKFDPEVFFQSSTFLKKMFANGKDFTMNSSYSIRSYALLSTDYDIGRFYLKENNGSNFLTESMDNFGYQSFQQLNETELWSSQNFDPTNKNDSVNNPFFSYLKSNFTKGFEDLEVPEELLPETTEHLSKKFNTLIFIIAT